jgi:hypothetical protein
MQQYHHSRRSPPIVPPPNYSPDGRGGSSSQGHGRWRSASAGQGQSPRLPSTYLDSDANYAFASGAAALLLYCV